MCSQNVTSLNEDLGDFISTIYLHKFEAQKTQKKHIARQLSALPAGGVMPVDVLASHFLSSLGCAMLGQPHGDLLPPPGKAPGAPGAGLLQRPISLALIRLRAHCARPQQAGYETHVRGEAALAAALVQAIRRACPQETIFVATPHRIQRQAVRTAIVSSRAASLRAEPVDNVDSGEDSDSQDFHDAVDDLDELEETFAKLSLGTSGGLALDQRACIQDTVERLQGETYPFLHAVLY